jgi:hypothetical protein
MFGAFVADTETVEISSLKEIFHSCAEGMTLVKHTELTIPISKKEIPQNINGKVLHSLVIYLDIHEKTGIIQIVDVI